ncbi:MAG TPA: hypothetical protein VNL77_19375, partial [Roseiflexaceae bacterium]|nr:hypothetical protein [Roseiflexaceae bacterium]
MPFSIEEFAELLRLLEERPEWRGALRQQLLTAELLAVPDTLRQIAELQARTEARLAELAGRVDVLDGRLRRVQQQVGGLAELVGASAELEGERALLARLSAGGYTVLAALGPLDVDGEVDVA